MPPILLTTPPGPLPAAPPQALARAAGLARGAGLPLRVMDLNLRAWLEAAGGRRRALEVLRGEEFHRPESYLAARRKLEGLAVEATWREMLARQAQGAAAVVLCLEAAEQAPAPELLPPEPALACWLEGGAPPKTASAAWGEIPLLHGPELAAWLWRATGQQAPAAAQDTPLPDYSGLPLADYLSPRVVLAWPTGQDPAADLAAARRAGAGAVWLAGEPLAPARLSGLAAGGEPLAWGFSARLEEWEGFDDFAALAAAGVRLIHWLPPRGAPRPALPLAALLRAASRTGLWNHLLAPADSELAAWAVANPNLAHSLDCPRPPASPYPPLSGRPLWRELAFPAHLLLYLQRHGARRLSRWRVRPGGKSLYQVGEGLQFLYAEPERLPPGMLDEAIELVKAGGAVAPEVMERNLRRAYLVACCLEEGELVGVSSLKRPRGQYLESLKQRTGLDLSDYAERGYTSVRPEYRGLGIGTKLLEGETALARQWGLPVYSILDAQNRGAQEMARRNRTRVVARFRNQETGKELAIWMPQWVLELPGAPQAEE